MSHIARFLLCFILGAMAVFFYSKSATAQEWTDIRLDCGTTIGTVHVLIPVGDGKRVRLTFTCKAEA
jgi:hypothetical protein